MRLRQSVDDEDVQPRDVIADNHRRRWQVNLHIFHVNAKQVDELARPLLLECTTARFVGVREGESDDGDAVGDVHDESAQAPGSTEFSVESCQHCDCSTR